MASNFDSTNRYLTPTRTGSNFPPYHSSTAYHPGEASGNMANYPPSQTIIPPGIQLRNYQMSTQNLSHQHWFIRKSLVCIDSSDRNQTPRNIIGDNHFTLENNSIKFCQDSNEVIVYHKNHGIKKNDKITIQNVVANEIIVTKSLIFSQNDFFIKIKHPNHGFNDSFELYEKQYLEIFGVVGINNNNTFIHNIPINILNKRHMIHLTKQETDSIDPDFYFIKIDIAPNTNYTDTKSRMKIKFLNLAGINLNKINARYPLDINHSFGNHIIVSVSNNKFKIRIPNTKATQDLRAGGSTVKVELVEFHKRHARVS